MNKLKIFKKNINKLKIIIAIRIKDKKNLKY